MLRRGVRDGLLRSSLLHMTTQNVAGIEVCGCSLKARSSAALLSSSRGYASNIEGLTLINKGLKQGPGGRSSISGITATVFGGTGFLGRYIINALAKAGSQVVVPYRCDDLDMQHLRAMGDLGQIIQYRDFDSRNDDQIRDAIKRSNLVINLIGIDKETMNWSFEETHIDVAQRIAKAASENDMLERYWHVSCLGAKEDATSRRLRTKFEGEKAVRRLLPKATIFKPAQMIGVEDRLFNNYAQLAKKFPLIPLIDGGHNRLQPVWVRDVADGMVNALKDVDAQGKDYYLAGPNTFTTKELVELTFETIREKYHGVYLPAPIARALAAPREVLKNKLPVPVNYLFTQDYIDECKQDHMVPADVMTFKDLNVVPQPIYKGAPIEHVRYFRVGGYEFGTTSDASSTGGAGFGGG